MSLTNISTKSVFIANLESNFKDILSQKKVDCSMSSLLGNTWKRFIYIDLVIVTERKYTKY
jgi:hypothetical protein